MFRFKFIPLLLVIYSSAWSQTSLVKGRIFEGNIPVEFVNVVLYKSSDSLKILQVSISDSLGQFQFKALPYDHYFLTTNFMGYVSKKLNILVDKKEVTIADIQVERNTRSLNSVTVKSQKKLIQKTENGLIINAGANLTQAGGTATDLLRNTPTVVVDAEGGITVRGKAPMILINGRSSGLTNTDRIPASSIDKIEIINNAGAQYDADAEGGIINIILKKNTLKGINGSIALGAGYGAFGRGNSAFIINQNKGKWNIGLSYDNRFANRLRKATSGRTNFNLPDEYQLTQDRRDKRYEETHNAKFNADYAINKYNSFGLELIGNFDVQHNNETLLTQIDGNTNNFLNKNSRFSDELGKERLLEGALNYEHQFKNKNQKLRANLSSTLDYDTENTQITTQALNQSNTWIDSALLQRTNNKAISNITTYKVDYTHPIGHRGLLDMGYKGISRNIETMFNSLNFENNEYINNAKASNTFDFREQINAIYGQYKGYIGKEDSAKWKYEMGLRIENVNNHGNTVDRSVSFKNSYTNYFPTVSLSYYFNESDYLKLGFNRRINRPDLEDLNPFVDITDSLNPHSGNPYLKPELIQAIELSHNKEWKKIALSTSIFYRHSTNIIRSSISLDSNGIALSKPNNFGTSVTVGLESICNVEVSTCWNFNLGVSMYQQKIDGSNVSNGAINSMISGYTKWTNNFKVWKDGKLQCTANYQAPRVQAQGKNIAIYNIDLGVQQKIWKNKAAIGCVVTDIFNTQKKGTRFNTSEFNSYRNFKVDTRAVILTFVYSFKRSFEEEQLENKFSNE